MRYVLLLLGILSLAIAWCIPIPHFDRHTFWAHMTVHMLVVAVAAPLLAFGIAGSRFDPVPKAPRLFSPIPGSVVELIVVWAWHSPVLHDFARHTTWGLLAEQTMFLATGSGLWLSVAGGHDAAASPRRAAGVVGLLLTSMHMTLLGALLALAPRPLFQHGHGHGHSALSALEDQQLGGAIMLLVGGISYMAGGLWLTLGLLRTQPVIQERHHDQPLVENR